MSGKHTRRDTGWWILIVGFTLIGLANVLFAPGDSGVVSSAQAALPAPGEGDCPDGP